MRLDGATKQLQFSQAAAIQGEMQIYPNRISFKELPDMLHDESSKFKAQTAVVSGQWSVVS
jgi:hypothetical protein